MLGNFSYCNPLETWNVKYKDVIIYKKTFINKRNRRKET